MKTHVRVWLAKTLGIVLPRVHVSRGTEVRREVLSWHRTSREPLGTRITENGPLPC